VRAIAPRPSGRSSEIVEAQWWRSGAGWRGFAPSSRPTRASIAAIERDMLPTCGRYGMGVMVWSAAVQGHAHRALPQGAAAARQHTVNTCPGRCRRDQSGCGRGSSFHWRKRRGLSLTHMSLAFVMAHPGVTSAILGRARCSNLDDLLAGAEFVSATTCWTRIDRIVPPGPTSD